MHCMGKILLKLTDYSGDEYLRIAGGGFSKKVY